MKKIDKTDRWLYIEGSYADALCVASVFYSLWKSENIKTNVVRQAIFADMFVDNESVLHFDFPPKGSIIVKVDCKSAENFTDKCTSICNQLDIEKIENIELLPPPKQLHFSDIDCLKTKKSKILLYVGETNQSLKIDPILLHQYNSIIESKKTIDIVQYGAPFFPHIIGTKSLMGETSYSKLYEVINKSNLIITTETYAKLMGEVMHIPVILLNDSKTSKENDREATFNIEDSVEQLANISLSMI